MQDGLRGGVHERATTQVFHALPEGLNLINHIPTTPKS